LKLILSKVSVLAAFQKALIFIKITGTLFSSASVQGLAISTNGNLDRHHFSIYDALLRDGHRARQGVQNPHKTSGGGCLRLQNPTEEIHVVRIYTSSFNLT